MTFKPYEMDKNMMTVIWGEKSDMIWTSLALVTFYHKIEPSEFGWDV